MPSQMMDKQGMSPLPYFSGELPFSGERFIGFRKADTLRNHYDARAGAPCSSPVASVPRVQMDSQSAKCLEIPEQVNFTLQRHVVGAEKPLNRSLNLWGSMDLSSGTRYSSNMGSSWDKSNGISSHYENGLFSSSLSELFSRKLRLSADNALYDNFVDTVASYYEEEPFESLEEMEAQTIGNLLPNDEDLLSGVVDGVEHIAQPSGQNDMEDLDLFSSVGGMDLGDEASFARQADSEFSGNSASQWGGTNASLIGKHPYGEHPSRTLFVRNISNVEDSELRALFEQYGDIHTLYTSCKHRGFVMISYYDIRAARNAMKALQNKPLRRRRLDIHYSIPKDNPSDKDVNQGTLVVFNLDSSVSNDDVLQIFGAYGEIKEIRETSQNSKKFIEFYDVRASDEAVRALNWSEIAGKKIQVEPSRLGVARRSSMLPLPPEMELDEAGLYLPLGSAEFLNDSIKGTSVKGETGLGTNAVIRAATGPPMENSFCHVITSSVPGGILSVLGAESTGKQPGLTESDNLVNQIKYDLRGLPNLHPHSLPEYIDGFPTVSCNSDDNIAASVNSLPSERVENHLLGRISSSIEMGNGFSSTGNASVHLAGRHYMWSNSNQPQPPAFMWPNSPSFANRFCTPQPQHRFHGLARSPSHMLNSASPASSPHVGSAPAVNRSMWEGRNSFAGGSPEASGLFQGPLGSVKFSDSHIYHMDLANMSPHVGGNGVDLPISFRDVGLHSLHHRSMMYPSRIQMNVGGSFEPHSERARSRRIDTSSSQADNKKQYELDVDRIRQGEDNRTTLMIKNIPNKYTSKMLMAAIDERHRGTYDFIYLPIDFKNKCNVGYAFINMVDPSHIIPFYETFNGKKWEKFNSEKVASLAYARIQGKAALITHFQNSSLMNEDKRCRPILFHSEGPNAGDQVPFPMGVNIRFRAGRSRSSSNEDDCRENSLNLANKEESSNGDSSSSSGKEFDWAG